MRTFQDSADQPRTTVGSPAWGTHGGYLLPETLPVFIRYPDGKRVVGYPGSWHWLTTGGVA